MPPTRGRPLTRPSAAALCGVPASPAPAAGPRAWASSGGAGRPRTWPRSGWVRHSPRPRPRERPVGRPERIASGSVGESAPSARGLSSADPASPLAGSATPRRTARPALGRPTGDRRHAGGRGGPQAPGGISHLTYLYLQPVVSPLTSRRPAAEGRHPAARRVRHARRAGRRQSRTLGGPGRGRFSRPGGEPFLLPCDTRSRGRNADKSQFSASGVPAVRRALVRAGRLKGLSGWPLQALAGPPPRPAPRQPPPACRLGPSGHSGPRLLRSPAQPRRLRPFEVPN
jgi:hypothetical protein